MPAAYIMLRFFRFQGIHSRPVYNPSILIESGPVTRAIPAKLIRVPGDLASKMGAARIHKIQITFIIKSSAFFTVAFYYTSVAMGEIFSRFAGRFK